MWTFLDPEGGNTFICIMEELICVVSLSFLSAESGNTMVWCHDLKRQLVLSFVFGLSEFDRFNVCDDFGAVLYLLPLTRPHSVWCCCLVDGTF